MSAPIFGLLLARCRRRFMRLLPSFIVIATVADSAIAGPPSCPVGWRESEGLPGVSGPINALTTWDPDGEGPEQPLLIAGGSFSIAGDVRANNIAAWNGSSWQAMGPSPMDGVNGEVHALEVYNGELFAGGFFTRTGAGTSGTTVNYIARWTGTEWEPLLGTDGGVGLDSNVWTLAVHDGALVAGGDFTATGGPNATQVVNQIGRWDGASWEAFGSGMGGFTVDATVVYNGELIAGGWFFSAGGAPNTGGIARWDAINEQWHPLGLGMQGAVYELAVYNGELIAGGSFFAAGGAPHAKIARWNGSAWQSLGAGVGGGFEFVDAMAVHNGELFAGGGFTHAGGFPVNFVARWNSTTLGWQSLGSGVTERVGALAAYGNQVVVGGRFTLASGVAMKHVAGWNASTGWQTLGSGMDQRVRAMTMYGTELIAGGDFTRAGSTTASRVAHWDGLVWEPIGQGFSDPLQAARVNAVTVYNGQLIAAGVFKFAGGGTITVNHIARWNGSTWQPLGDGLGGAGVSTGVNAMVVYDDELIVGGRFTTAGGITATNIARWNGTTWQALDGSQGEGVGAAVYALAVFNGQLIAGGAFTSAGGSGASHIAAWSASPEEDWERLGSAPLDGVQGDVHALTPYQGELIVGGSFSIAGEDAANNIARWDNAAWETLGSGLVASASAMPVCTLAVFNGELFAGGGFTLAGETTVRCIARWDATAGSEGAWVALEDGISGSETAGVAPIVHAMVVCDEELVVGGNFTMAGQHVAGYWARWGSLCTPGDITGDGHVDVDDLLAVITAWGACAVPPDPCPADIAPAGAPDGVVNVDDLLMVIVNWG